MANKLSEVMKQGGRAMMDRWHDGEPYRVAVGALMSGDGKTAKDVMEQNAKDVTPKKIRKKMADGSFVFVLP